MEFIARSFAFAMALVLGTLAALFFTAGQSTGFDRGSVGADPFPAVQAGNVLTKHPSSEPGNATKPQGITVAYAGMGLESGEETAYLKYRL